jgi:outer membrane lipoprotein-sorting protein
LTNSCLRLRDGRRFLICRSALCIALAGLLAGCQHSAPAPTAEKEKTASEYLHELVTRYRNATSYRDQAVVRLQYSRDYRLYQDEAPLSVAWTRPNRVAVEAYQAALICDGKSLYARITDPDTSNFDGQIVERPAPEKLAVPDIYQQDQVLNVAFRQGLVGYPPQLELLLSEDALRELTADETEKTLMGSEQIEGTDCRRIRARTPDGSFIFWISKKTGALLRLEYPVAAFAPQIAADSSVQNVQLLVEFRGASLGQSPDADAFAFSVPEDAKRVRTFVPPPQQLPSDLFGTTAPNYAFVSLDGSKIDSTTLNDRVKVLVWFNDHPACRVAMEQLSQVYSQYKDRDDVQFLGVCVEPAQTSELQIRNLVERWNVDVPVVRDPQACGRDIFRIPWAPTTVVLNGEDTVQIFEAGANPNLATELPQVVERVLAGEDLASEILEQHRQTQLAYQRAIENGGPIEQDPASSKVLPATDPIALQMKQLWTNTQLSAPGNVLAINDPSGSFSFLAYDGWRSVIELNVEGQIIDKHVLPLPRMAAVSQLRSYLGGNGQRYYLAWSLRDFQAHVFDATWNRVLSYPPTTEKHDGVQDATMSDVDGDGQLELVVGFWGNQGVHCVSLDGTPRWINAESPNVFSVLARRSDNRATQLCVAGAAGEPLFLNDRGQAATDAPQPPERIHHLFASHSGSNAALCGLSYGADGQRLVVGLDRSLQGTWRYRLPAGTFSTQVSFVTAAEILGYGQYDWLIAGPDGSVHIISGDGRFTDKFQTGEVLRGLAGGRQGDAGILVVSTQKGICAWSVTPPATAGQTRRGKQ